MLQLVPYPSIVLLYEFCQSKVPPCHLQLWIPALGNIFRVLPRAGQAVIMPEQLVLLADWLSRRAHQVYSRLSQHDTPQPNPYLISPDWRISGVCYGSPPIRIRPHYTSIPDDGLPEDKLRNQEMSDSECRKYYETYKKASLTGGLMVLWCRHSICLGFHIIPSTEGRNDVFAALYTQWPIAPKVVVYDFACQLAPYSFVREPKFFQNTRFVVDKFHANGHTKCTKASSATHAMQYDPNLEVVNTSAAEVGNSGTAKIRKSVSYMTQIHAIQYTKVYMDVTNRCRWLKMTRG